MRFLCLINLSSGANKGKKLAKILAKLTDFEIEVISVYKFNPNDFDFTKYDRVLIAGGDGTFSRLLAFLLDINLPVGILPLGTGNDLAREAKVFNLFSLRNPESIIEFYKQAKYKDLSIWKLESDQDIYFSNYLSIGFDANTVRDFDYIRNNYIPKFLQGALLNKFYYFLVGLKNSLSPSINVKLIADKEYDLSSYKLKSVIFSNIQSCMGLGKTNTISSAYENKLEIVMIKNVFNYVGMVLPFLKPEVLSSVDNFALETDSKYIQLDGESYMLKKQKLKVSFAGKVKLLVAN